MNNDRLMLNFLRLDKALKQQNQAKAHKNEFQADKLF